LGTAERHGVRRDRAGDHCGRVRWIDFGERADGLPLSKKLIAGAIGESGALISTLPARTRAEAEKDGVRSRTGRCRIARPRFRALSAEAIQENEVKLGAPSDPAGPACDSGQHRRLFSSQTGDEIFEAGEQAKVRARGSNSMEQSPRSFSDQEPTPENFAA